MSKTKNKKKNLAEATSNKKRKEQSKKTLNPFEVHINREKQKVIGKKGKNDRGLPGVSRAKAINKRKGTLLQEFRHKDKDNTFLDKRIGEKNRGMTMEERAIARFAAEKVRSHKKKNIYSLNDEEVLTHRGQTLEEVEKFDDPRSEDEMSEDEDRLGKLGKKFVSDAHFGGGVLSRPESSSGSRKDVIEQLIAESKKRKADRQKMKEETVDLTEKLDSEWRDLLPLVNFKTSEEKGNISSSSGKREVDDYDIAVREMKFEARGQATDKLKSEETIREEEQKKIEEFESERISRMQVPDTSGGRRHKSAEDLDDGYFVREKIVDESEELDESVPDENLEQQPMDTLNDGEDNSDSDEASESEEEDLGMDQEASDREESDLNEETSDREAAPSGDESSGDDDLMDLKQDESASEDEGETVACKKPILILTTSNRDTTLVDSEKTIKLVGKQSAATTTRDKFLSELKVPETYEEFELLLGKHEADYQGKIVQQIIKIKDDKEYSTNLFIYLMQYTDDCMLDCENIVRSFQIFDRLCPFIYDLAKKYPDHARQCIKEILKEKHEHFESNKKRFPALNTIIFFKLVSLLYTTSDFRHPIVTPCLVFMSQILLRCKIRNRTHISKALFVATLILEYTTLSKRLPPSAINILRGIVFMAIPKPETHAIKVTPPVKRFGLESILLVLEEDSNLGVGETTRMRAEDLINPEIDEDFKVRALVTALNLISEFRGQLEGLQASWAVFEPIYTLLRILPLDKYSNDVKALVKSLRRDLKTLSTKELKHLVREKKKPKPMRQYEPRIERIYDFKRHKTTSRERAEKEKLLHKYKTEMKSAVREIRKDRSFLAKVQIKKQIASDAERKRKVKELFGDASVQQSELKKMDRRKKKK